MRRFVLIDYLHLAYKCYNIPPMTAVVNINGVPEQVDTTIPKITIGDVWRYASHGKHSTGVFLEGGALVRSAYFKAVNDYRNQLLADKGAAVPLDAKTQLGYKGDRKGLSGAQSKGVDLTVDLLLKGGTSVYQIPGYEADDLIWLMIQQLKTQFPDAKIDVFTCDMDMLPLVDEQVSVYMRGNRTYAEPLCGDGYCTESRDLCAAYASDECLIKREFKGYYQVTPRTWSEFMSYRSAFKGVNMPYNAVYLYKMIKGDTSDNVPCAVKGYGPKKLNALFEKMQEDGVDFATAFRYDSSWESMEAILKNYFSEEELLYIKMNAEGIRLRSDMSPLINLIPPEDSNATNTEINVAAVYNTLINQQTYQPANNEQYRRAMLVYDAVAKGVPFGTPTLTAPLQPEYSRLQKAVFTDYKIKLATGNVDY